MATKNPFVSALEGWAVDPEAEAKGALYRTQQGKLTAETDILKDRIGARRRFYANSFGAIPQHVRDAQLSNEVINPAQGADATRTHLGLSQLFGPDGRPNVNLSPAQRGIAFAALNYNPDKQAAHMLGGGQGVYEDPGKAPEPIIKDVNGVLHQLHNVNGMTFFSPVPGQVSEKVNPPTFPGSQGSSTRTSVLPDGTVQSKTTPLNVVGTNVYDPARAADILNQMSRSGIATLGNAALTYPTGPYGYLLDRAMHRLTDRGDLNQEVMGLNRLQASSVISLAERFAAAGYPPTEAFASALDAHPEIKAAIQSGKWDEKDFSGSPGGKWYDFLVNNTDLDANKAPLPELGGTFRATPGFATSPSGDYSNIGSRIPVPAANVLMAQPDVGALVQAGTAMKPSLASPMPSTPLTDADVGKFYYSGPPNSPTGFFVARKDQNGVVTAQPITGLRQ